MTKDDLQTQGFDYLYEALSDRMRKNVHCFVTGQQDAEFERFEQLKRLHIVYLVRKKDITGIMESYTQYVYKLTEFGYKMKELCLNVELRENECRELFAKHVFEHLKKVI